MSNLIKILNALNSQEFCKRKPEIEDIFENKASVSIQIEDVRFLFQFSTLNVHKKPLRGKITCYIYIDDINIIEYNEEKKYESDYISINYFIAGLIRSLIDPESNEADNVYPFLFFMN